MCILYMEICVCMLVCFNIFVVGGNCSCVGYCFLGESRVVLYKKIYI